MQEKNNRFKYTMISSICLAVFCVAMFLFLMIKYKVSGVFDVDQNLINFSSKIRSEGLTNFFEVITHFGSMLTVAILAVIMAIVCKPIWVKIFAVVNVGFVAVFCFIVKHIIRLHSCYLDNIYFSLLMYLLVSLPIIPTAQFLFPLL